MAYGEIIFWSLGFLLLGIGLSGSGWSGLAILIVTISCALLVGFWKFFNKPFWLILFIAMSLLGSFYFQLCGVFYESKIKLPQTETKFKVFTTELSRSYEYITAVPVKIMSPWTGELDLLLGVPANFNYGEVLEIKGTIDRNKWPEKSVIRSDNIVRAGQIKPSGIRSYLVPLRERLIEATYLVLPPDQAAFIAGITVGARGGISPRLKEALRTSGTTHLLVLSGYNILIVILAGRRLLEKLLSRKKRFYFISFGLFLFLMLVAAEPSVTRAGIMGWLILLGEHWGRLVHFGYLALLAGSIMSIFNPALVSSDIGFQLSFLSLLGIAYVAPIFKKYLENLIGEKVEHPLVAAAYETAAAQLLVWPLLSFYFGNIYLTGLLANMLILPLMPIVMVLGITLSVVALINVQLGIILGLAVKPLIDYILAIINLFSWITLPLPNISQAFVVLIIYSLIAILLLPRIIANKR